VIVPPERRPIHHWILLVLISLGLEAMFLFARWWLSPAVWEPGSALFWVLTLTIGFGFFRTAIIWFFYLNLKHERVVTVGRGPTVDVFTTIMKSEPFEMIVETLEAIQRMDYPHTTYLLDSRWDEETEALCKRLDVTRVRSDNVPGAKGGAVNNALERSDGELVLILDPDHVPDPRFLDYSVAPFVGQPRLGFVQVVQGYYNQKESFVAAGAAEQTYGYYGPMQMGMSGLGAAQAIGANCMFRRAALESIGGHACHLAEDMVTAIRLHSRGWRSTYVPVLTARGLVPADLGSYFRQQFKWATGLSQILCRDIWPWIGGLSWRQRLVYLSNSTYYLTGIVTGINLLMAPIFLLLGTWATAARVEDFIVHGMPFAIMSTAVYFYVQIWIQDRRERGWHWRGMILKIASWPVLVAGLLSGALGVTVRYLPTRKTRSDRLRLAIIVPHLAIIGLTVAAISVNLAKPFRQGERFIVVLCAWNILMMMGAIWAANEKPLRTSLTRLVARLRSRRRRRVDERAPLE